MKYRKKVLIEAYHYPFAEDVPQNFKDAIHSGWKPGVNENYIVTMEGDSYVVDDCWIAMGVNGEFWRIDNQVFADTYEPVDDVQA
jgi:hypothetical protein